MVQVIVSLVHLDSRRVRMMPRNASPTGLSLPPVLSVLMEVSATGLRARLVPPSVRRALDRTQLTALSAERASTR